MSDSKDETAVADETATADAPEPTGKADDAPKADDAKADDAPTADDAPKADDAKADDAPTADDAPKADAAKADDAPTADDAPKADDAPTADDAPKADDAPTADDAPKADDAEAAPAGDSDAAASATSDAAASATSDAAASATKEASGSETSVGEKLLLFFGSYGLSTAVVLFLFLLTFLGTIQQVHDGLYVVQKRYFESLFVLHPLSFGSLGTLPVPLPGVYLLLIVLAINLGIGGLLRIRKSKRTAGVIIVHVGMMLLLVAGFVKLKFSDDGHMTLFEGDQAAHYVDYHQWEIAIWEDKAEGVKEYLIPDAEIIRLVDGRETTYSSPELPFKLKLSHYVRNSRVLPMGPNWTSATPVVDGFGIQKTDDAVDNELNIAGLYVEAQPEAGEPQKGLLWGWRGSKPMVVEAGGKRYAVDLRRKHHSLPFTIKLDKFTHELYPNSSMAKVFKSDVTKIEGGTQTQVVIEMNEPLRHRGFVLFQSKWFRDPNTGQLQSTFAVVRNPSDYWPLYACIVISIGLLLAFGQKLAGYVRGQAAKRSGAAAKGA